MKLSQILFLCFSIWFQLVSNTASQQQQRIAETKAGLPCLSDIAVLVDASTSITHENFVYYVIPFLHNLTQAFGIRPDRTHLAMVRFCSPQYTEIVFDFNFEQSVSKILDKIDNDGYCAGRTSLVKALNLTYDWVFSKDHGARDYVVGANNLTRVAIIITDGVATDAKNQSYIPTVDMLIKDKYVNMFAVGVGILLNPKYLKMLTGNLSNRVFSVDEFDQLKSVVDALVSATGCTTVARPIDSVLIL